MPSRIRDGILMGMVVAVTPLPIGNALRIQVAPPNGAKFWILLRNTTNVFPGPTDPLSTLVTQSTETVLYDAVGLSNGTTYYYEAFYWDGFEWLADAESMSGVPAAAYFDSSTDAMTLLQARLEVGMQNEVAMGNVVPGQNANGVIQVLNAPPIFEDTQFPVVVVHLTNEAPAEHGIGEFDGTDSQGADGQWPQTEGWIARTTISVIAWCLNPDVRKAMRKALRRLVIGNLQVLYSAGLREIDFSQQDTEELGGTFGAPVYWAECTFSCLSPLAVGGQVPAIADITVTIDAEPVILNERISSAGSTVQ